MNDNHFILVASHHRSPWPLPLSTKPPPHTISTIVTIIYRILSYLCSSKAPQLVNLPIDANSIPTMTKAEPA